MLIEQRERWPWKGWGRFTVIEHDGLCPEVLNSARACRCQPRVEVEEVDNLIVDSGRNFVRDSLRGAVTSPQILYVALGDSSTGVLSSQTKLIDELFRKAITKYAAGVTGESIVTALIAPAEANFGIQEVGWFGFPAGIAKDSGTLVSRLLWAHTKTNLEALQLEHHDLF